MRRYRKGQIYKPPSAADSAAIADVAEAYRRAPVRPQDYRPTGQVVEVLTPAAGIPARDGTTIYWALCTRCIHIDDGDEKTRVDTDDQVIVHNLSSDVVAGDAYVRTGLTDTGLRHVLGGTTGGGIVRFQNFTWLGGDTGGLTSVLNTITAVGNTVSIGDHGIAWDGTNKWFASALGGAYTVAARLTYRLSATAWSAVGFCDPALAINPAQMVTRYNVLSLVAYPSVTEHMRDQFAHLNSGSEADSYDVSLSFSTPINIGPGSTNAVKLGVQSFFGGADAWDIQDAEISFTRHGNLMIT